MNKIRELRISNNMTMKQAAEALDLPYTTYVNYEKGAREPNSEILIKFANYYNVSIDYLIGHTPKSNAVLTVTEKDERDIAKTLETLMDQLDSGSDLMFDGDPISDEARESIRSAMKLGLEAAKIKNKERFTPKKYRKG